METGSVFVAHVVGLLIVDVSVQPAQSAFRTNESVCIKFFFDSERAKDPFRAFFRYEPQIIATCIKGRLLHLDTTVRTPRWNLDHLL